MQQSQTISFYRSGKWDFPVKTHAQGWLASWLHGQARSPSRIHLYRKFWAWKVTVGGRQKRRHGFQRTATHQLPSLVGNKGLNKSYFVRLHLLVWSKPAPECMVLGNRHQNFDGSRRVHNSEYLANVKTFAWCFPDILFFNINSSLRSNFHCCYVCERNKAGKTQIEKEPCFQWPTGSICSMGLQMCRLYAGLSDSKAHALFPARCYFSVTRGIRPASLYYK